MKVDTKYGPSRILSRWSTKILSNLNCFCLSQILVKRVTMIGSPNEDGDTNKLVFETAVIIWFVFCACHFVSVWSNEILSEIVWCIHTRELWREIWLYFVTEQWKQTIDQALSIFPPLLLLSHLATKTKCRKKLGQTQSRFTPLNDQSNANKVSGEAFERIEGTESVAAHKTLPEASKNRLDVLDKERLDDKNSREWHPSINYSWDKSSSSAIVQMTSFQKRTAASPKSVTSQLLHCAFSPSTPSAEHYGKAYHGVTFEEALNLNVDLDNSEGVLMGTLPCVIERLNKKHSTDSIEFFLPKLHAWCQCKHCELYIKYKKERLIKIAQDQDIAAINIILRPWQVDFLYSVGIYSLNTLIEHELRNAEKLKRSLTTWRNAHGFQQYSSKSCSIALHIWAQAANTALKSKIFPVSHLQNRS